MGMGWVLAISVAAGTAGGYYSDRWLNTTPWLTLLGIFLGMAVGFTSVFRTLLGHRETDESRSTKHLDSR
ncbi:MAG: AtpZ/AtpI family protein [Acidobacteriota bacterium]